MVGSILLSKSKDARTRAIYSPSRGRKKKRKRKKGRGGERRKRINERTNARAHIGGGSTLIFHNRFCEASCRREPIPRSFRENAGDTWPLGIDRFIVTAANLSPDSKLYASDSVETIRREADRSVAKWWRAKNVKKKARKKFTFSLSLSLSLRWLLPRSSAEEGHDRFASFREKPLYGRGHACISKYT